MKISRSAEAALVDIISSVIDRGITKIDGSYCDVLAGLALDALARAGWAVVPAVDETADLRQPPCGGPGWYSTGLSYEYAKPADMTTIADLRRRLMHLDCNLSEVTSEYERYRRALEQIAAPKRPDGTYNRCREACELLARQALRLDA